MKLTIFSVFIPLFLTFVLSARADVYEDLAKATGGKVTRMTKDEFNKSVQDGKNRYEFLKNAVPVIAQTLASDDSTKSLEFSVDSAAFGGLVVEAIGHSGSEIPIELVDPNGKTVKALKESGDPKLPVSVTLPDRIAVIVPSPQIGVWKIKILKPFSGDLIIRLQSHISILKSRFVRMGGRSGHQGMFPYEGELKAKSNEFLEYELYGAKTGEVTLSAIDSAGKVLSKTKASGGQAKIEIPSVPFRLLYKGSDDKGKEFQRVTDSVFRPKAD